MAKSFFNKLFDLAKTERRAIENYMTEVLAAAVRQDAAPILQALRHFGLLDENAKIPEIRPDTQVPVGGAGIIDLVLQIDRGTGSFEVWIEIKIYSPESGDQLDNYIRAAADHHARLATLSREPLRAAITAMTWQWLWEAAESSEASYWKDLRSFLEELEMADDYNKPIDASEIKGLAPAYGLIRKAAHILEPVTRHANAIFPQGNLPTTNEDIRKEAAKWFAKQGQFAVCTSHLPAGLTLGLCPAEDLRLSPAEEGVKLGVWVSTDPRSRRLKARLIEQAKQGGLDASWDRRADNGWVTLVAWRSIDPGTPLSECSDWLKARIDELNAAGVLTLIPCLKVEENWWEYMQEARRKLEESGHPFMNDCEMAAWIEGLRSDDDRLERAYGQVNSPAPE